MLPEALVIAIHVDKAVPLGPFCVWSILGNADPRDRAIAQRISPLEQGVYGSQEPEAVPTATVPINDKITVCHRVELFQNENRRHAGRIRVLRWFMDRINLHELPFLDAA